MLTIKALSVLCYGVVTCLFASGFFLLLAHIFNVPTLQSQKIVRKIHYIGKGRKTDAQYEEIIDIIAIPISKKTPFPGTMLDKYEKMLTSSNSETSAAVYLSRCISKSIVICIISFACSIILPQMMLIGLITPVIIFWYELKKADKITAKHRAAIEQELPDFVNNISTQLMANRDIIRMMQDYSVYAKPALQTELRVTIVDMQSGNYEAALHRFAGRINSPTLNNVIRGLLGVVQGNNEVQYFAMLGYDLKQKELSELKKDAQKNVPRLTMCSTILLVSIIALFMSVLGYDLYSASNALFL